MDEKLDELINSLLDAYRAYLEAHRSEDGVQRRDRATTAADAIRALFAAQAAELAAARERERWIPVAERLPVDSTAAHSVLVMASRWSFEKAKHLLWTAYYDELQSKWLDDVDHEPLIVSCWKDAPQPPAPEAQQ